MYKSAGRQVKRKRTSSTTRVRLSTVTPKTKALLNLPKLVSRGKEINHHYLGDEELFPAVTFAGYEYVPSGAVAHATTDPVVINDIDVGSGTTGRVGRMIKLQRLSFRMSFYTNVELNSAQIRTIIVFDKKPQADLPKLQDVFQSNTTENYICMLPREVNADRFEILYDKVVTLNGNNQLRANRRDITIGTWDVTFNQNAATSNAHVHEVIDLSPARFYTLYKSATTTGGAGDVDYGQLISFQFSDLQGGIVSQIQTRSPYTLSYGELQWTDK